MKEEKIHKPQTMTKKPKGNLRYALGLISEADWKLLVYTLFKNSAEQVFIVFYFVYLTKYIYECIADGIPYRKLFTFLVVACSLHVVMHFINGWYEAYRKVKTPDIYRVVFYKVMRTTDDMELRDFEDPAFYDSYAKALDRCVDSAMNIAIKLGVFIGNVVSTVASLVIVMTVDSVLLVFMVIPILASFYFGKKNSKCNYEMTNAVVRNRRISDYIKRIYYEKRYAAELRMYDCRDMFVSEQEEAVNRVAETTMKYNMKSALYKFCMYGSYSIISGIGAYIYVAFMLKKGFSTDVAGYIAMISAMTFSTDQLRMAVENGIFIGSESLLFVNLRSFLERKSVKKEEKDECGRIEEVEFRNVTFRYPGAKKDSLNNVSFIWKRGERIALVGHNGAGKTTFVKLIMGLYPLDEGQILVNGRDINDFDGNKYREHFGTVFQDLQIFSMTLCENVLMKFPESPEDYRKAEEALKMAQFDTSSRGLVKGMDTIITREFDEEGFICSGGQAQKIAIARVFVKDPDMIILDEPSSALDPLAEYNMYNNMMSLSEGKGVIFISHRLSSARMAGRIYMLKDGRVIEQGTHEELMDMKGEYYNMFMLQAESYQDSTPEEMIRGEATFYG